MIKWVTMLSTKALRKFIVDLKSSDDSKRRNAAQELAEGDERAVYPLILALHDQNSGVQDAAMHSLIAIGGELTAYMVIPLLRGDALLRNTAIIILQSLGRVSVPLLYQLLKDKDDDVRKFAVDMMGEIRDDVIPERLIPYLEDPNANVRAATAKTLGSLQYTDAVPELASALGNDEEWVIFSILETLGMLRAEESVPAIARLLHNESVATRYAAIETLGVIGSDAGIEPLLECVKRSEDDDEKAAAVKSLVQIGLRPDMKELSGILGWMVRESEWEDKLIAIRGLVELNDCSATVSIIDISGSLDPSMPQDEERLSVSLDALRTLRCEDEILGALDDTRIRFRGRVIASGLLGDLQSYKSAPTLIAHMKTDKRDVQRACADAMVHIVTEQTAAELLPFVHNSDGHLRKSVMQALGKVAFKPAFDGLMGILTNEAEYPDVREEAVKAVCRIDPYALHQRAAALSAVVREMCGRYSDDIDLLLTLSEDAHFDVKVAAVSGLARICDERATARLEAALADVSADVRRAAVNALGASERSYEKLRGMFKDSDLWVRAYAVKAIGDSMDPTEVYTLSTMLKDPEIPVAIAAVEALARIGGEDAMRAMSEHSMHAEGPVVEAIERALEFA